MGSASSRLRAGLLTALAALSALAVLTAALYLCHGTRSAFLWVYLPILQLLVPGEVTSEGGRLSLHGQLEADGLRYRYREGELEVEVELGRGTLTFAPFSWITEPPFRARDLEIESLEVRITSHASSDPLAEPPLPLPRDPTPPALPEIPALRIPFAADRMRIASFRVEIRDSNRTRAIVGPGSIELSGLEPDGTLKLDIASGAELAPGELGHYQGKVELGLNVDLDHQGEIVNARGVGDVVLLFADKPEQPPLDISLEIDARSPVPGILDTSVVIGAAQHDTAIGRIEGTFHVARPHVAKPRSEPVFRALVVLAAIDADLLNIPLAFLGRERLASGTLNGAAALIQSEPKGPVTAQVELDVAKLRREQHERGTRLPAIDVHATLKGDFEPEHGRIDLEQLHGRFHRGGRDRLRVDLAAPVSLLLPGEDDEQGLRFPGHAKINARADGMDLVELPHVLNIFGIRTLLPLDSGLVSGNLVIDIEDMGKRLKTSGTLGVTDAHLSREMVGRDIEPLELRARLDGQLDTFENLLLRKIELDVRRRGVDIASLALRGSWDGAKETTDLDLKLEAGSLATLLTELELAPDPSALRLAGGGVVAGAQLHLAGDQPELEITSRLRVADLALARGDAPGLTVDLELDGDTRFVRESGMIELRQIDLTLQPHGESGPARIRATGVIPTRKNGDDQPPALRSEIENLAARPWLALAGVADPGLGPMPIAGALVIGLEGEPARLQLGGSPSVRLRPRSAADAEGEEITVTLEGRADAVLDGVTRFAAHVSSGSDDLDVEGVLKPGERPHLHVSAKVRSLQLRTYEALLATPPDASTKPSQGLSQGPTAEALADAGEEPHTALLPLDLPLDLKIQGEIASLHYGAIPLENAVVEVEATAGALVVSLPAATLSGGALRGSFRRRAEGSDPEQLEIDLHGTKVEIRPILAELAPDIAIKNGNLDLSVSGGAETPLGRNRLDTFRGNLSLLLSNGRIISNDFNSALTGDTFARSLEGLAFDGLDAKLEIADGVARIQRMKVLGSAARLNITGQATLRGVVDARISTEVGPELQKGMKKGVATSVIEGVGNLLVVPVQITAQGQIPNIRYAARTGLPGQPLGPAGEAMGDVTQGTVESIGETVRFGIDILRGIGGPRTTQAGVDREAPVSPGGAQSRPSGPIPR